MTCTGQRRSWTARDGEKFFYTTWPAIVAPQALLVAVHGLSGAAIDFEPLGHHFAPLGWSTFALELRGQGSDPLPRRRGDLHRLENWFADLRAFLALVRERHPGRPIFLYGESMGAAILTQFLARTDEIDPASGLILASPVVMLPREAAWWQRGLFRLLFCVCPTLRVNVRKITKPRKGAAPAYVTRDEGHRRWFESAPHRLDAFSIRFFKCLHDLIAGCTAAAPAVHLPTLVVYAGHDIFISATKVETFFELLGSHNKEREFFADSYHLLLHDHDRSKVLARIEKWLVLHAARATVAGEKAGRL